MAYKLLTTDIGNLSDTMLDGEKLKNWTFFIEPWEKFVIATEMTKKPNEGAAMLLIVMRKRCFEEFKH